MAAIQDLVLTLSQDALHTTKESETLDACIVPMLNYFSLLKQQSDCYKLVIIVIVQGHLTPRHLSLCGCKLFKLTTLYKIYI